MSLPLLGTCGIGSRRPGRVDERCRTRRADVNARNGLGHPSRSPTRASIGPKRDSRRTVRPSLGCLRTSYRIPTGRNLRIFPRNTPRIPDRRSSTRPRGSCSTRSAPSFSTVPGSKLKKRDAQAETARPSLCPSIRLGLHVRVLVAEDSKGVGREERPGVVLAEVEPPDAVVPTHGDGAQSKGTSG